METEHIKSYHKGPTIHKVNVFHFYTSYVFFRISCDICKKQHKCHDTKHKSNICFAAKATEKLLSPYIRGQNSGFVADEFFIASQYDSFQDGKIFNGIIEKLRLSYMKKNARE